jgi:MFS transporter, ACS family, tartrate transporter
MTPGDGSALERRTLRTVQRRLLPLLFLMYLAILLVRANLGLAALQMNPQLGISATAYGLGASIFILGYAPLAVPSSLAVARVGARRWLAPIVIASGVAGSAMMLVRGPASLYLMRFLLGVVEAGFFPGAIYYLNQWMPAAQRARTMALFMAAIPVAGVVSGGLAGVLLGFQGRLGLAGWQWLFLLEGTPAVILGLLGVRALVDDPSRARWLSPEQRVWLIERLERERAPLIRSQASGLRGALAERAVWQLGFLTFLVMASAYAYGAWSPQLIKGMTHLDDTRVGLISGGIAVASVVGMLVTSAHSDARRERFLHIAVPALLVAFGWLLCGWFSPGGIGVVALALVALGVSSQYGPFWALPGALLSGTAQAGGVGLIGAMGSVGGFIGPLLVGRLRDGLGDFRAAYLLLGLAAGAAGLVALWMRRAPGSLLVERRVPLP